MPPDPTGLVDLVLIDAGDKKIAVIKEIRGLTDLDLRDAKNLSERTPSVIVGGIPQSQADLARALLEKAGAVVELRPAGEGSIHGHIQVGSEETALRSLADEGILSENELLDARNALWGERPVEFRKMTRMLSELHHLYKEGVLSESEFNTKKWEVLSRK
ncbi:MAG TPA: ribosomal protein L7/L12 [Actinomycetota bacterium]|nr:ribosomal protein L7/L12 [Actinomycetota bacterium]